MLLCAASEAGDVVEVSRLLTECDVPANVCGLRHKTPLHLAASQGHVEVVDVLLAHGVSNSGIHGYISHTHNTHTYTHTHTGMCILCIHSHLRIFPSQHTECTVS